MSETAWVELLTGTAGALGVLAAFVVAIIRGLLVTKGHHEETKKTAEAYKQLVIELTDASKMQVESNRMVNLSMEQILKHLEEKGKL